MHDKLSEKDVVKLVAEVSKLDDERRKSLDRQQLSQILEDLNLPVEMLDEAMIRVQQQAVQKKERNKVIKLLAVALVVTGLAFGSVAVQNSGHQAKLSQITGDSISLSAGSAKGDDVEIVTAGSGMVFATVTLRNAPIGQRVPMNARWISPDGSVYKENSWKTKEVTTATWPTHAKAKIGSGAPKGEWKVEFLVNGTVIATRTFEVK